MQKSSSAVPCIVSLVIAFIWLGISFFVSLLGLDIPEDKMHLWLRLSQAVVMFPLDFLSDLNKDPVGLTGRAIDVYYYSVWVLNSLFWGFLLVALYHRVARHFVRKEGK